jgi:hypothetical protein
MGNIYGVLFIFGVAIAGWLIDDMAVSQGPVVLKYFFTAILLAVTAYSGMKWLVNPPPPTPTAARKKSTPASG